MAEDRLRISFASHAAFLREAFAELEVLDYQRTFDECTALVRKAFG